MERPDSIFTEPWQTDIKGEKTVKEFIERTERAWSLAAQALPKIKEVQERVKTAGKELRTIKGTMEEAKIEVQQIEKLTEKAEKEVEMKKEALEILDNLIEAIQITRDEEQTLEEPLFKETEEVVKIEQALNKVKKCLSIDHPRLLSLEIVKEKQKHLGKVCNKFERKAKEYLIRVSVKGRNKHKSPEEIHEVHSRYGEIIKFLRERKSFEECLREYAVAQSKMYKSYIGKKVEDVLSPFKSKKSTDKESLSGRVEDAVRSILDLVESFVSTESYFIRELFVDSEREKDRLTRSIFLPVEQEIVSVPRALYELGYEVGVINLLAAKFQPSKKEEIIMKTSDIISEIKKEVQDLLKKYLEKMKKEIGREYMKEGPINLDKVFYNVVDTSVVPALNTEIVRLNLVDSGKTEVQRDKILQTVKRACILGSIQAHYLENKEKYEAEVKEQVEEEVEKMTSNLLYLAESKVFEKDKISSIVKRTKEIMDLLNKVEDPLGFTLQIAFKDMILSKVNLHQRNEVAKVL